MSNQLFNHDGTKIVSGSYDKTIRVWNVDTGECILTLKGHTWSVYSVVFNHDGTKIVSGSYDNTIRVWNVDTGECILTLKGHTDWVNQLYLIMMVQRLYLDRMIKQYVYGMLILVNVY